MREKILIVITAIMLFVGFNMPCYAIFAEQSEVIQAFLDETCRISGVPGITVSVRVGEDIRFFSSGYADREKSLSANEDTLFELASVSKAFTAFGILLLEEQGLLSMDDPVQKYLPWFTLQYKGKPVDMDGVTLNNFLYHTSGLVNYKHYSMLPKGSGPDMLQQTVEAFIDAELEFMPGERFEYCDVNYDVLGQIVAVVSGQQWEDFMRTKVLDPLGLHETYMYEHEAYATGRLAKGYVGVYGRAVRLKSPPYEGNKPAGYIISCAKDMQRWTDIQIGLVEDIPEIYKAVVKKSHRADMSVPISSITTSLSGYYAGGWAVTADGTYIGHGGNNPNFTTDVIIYPKENIVITMLSNSDQTNNAIAPTLVNNIKGILDGELNQKYTFGIRQILDLIGTWMTIIGLLLFVLFLLLGLRRWKNRGQNPISKKRIVLTAVWSALTVVITLSAILYPSIMGVNWPIVFEEKFYSHITGLIALVLTCGSFTWFVFARRK